MRRPVVFGKYLLLDRISVGGMAEVFQAKSFGVEGFEKILAIKRILPSMAEDADFIDMFIDEAKIAGQLSHANICQIFELGKIDSSHFIAMEFVWGKDTLQIQNRFRRLRRRMPLPMAAFIAAKAAEGLDYAHRKRDANGQPLDIIHRDVSPQNILVSYEGEVKVIDFGIAKAVSRSSKTQAGVLKGKFGYMSPEQVRGLPLDRRSDIFALGTILWEMCVGERLFTGESDFAILEKVRNADVQPPSVHNPMVPEGLERIVMKALTREADDRYHWANEMQEDLMGWLMSQSPVFTVKQLSTALKEMFSRERQREQGALEEYKRIRRDDLAGYSPPTGQRELALSQLAGPTGPQSRPPPPPPPMEDSTEPPTLAANAGLLEVAEAYESPDDFDDGRTELGGPDFMDDDASPLDDDDIREIHEPLPHPSEFDDGRTEIYGNDAPAASPPMAAEPTYIFNAESGQLVHAPDQATVIFADLVQGGGNGSGAAARPTTGSDVIYDANRTASPSGTAPVVAPARSSVIKDILIGVLLALVVILGIVLWRVFAAGGSSSQEARATVVVSATPPTSGRVLVDGKTVGLLVAGKPFSREVAAGKHKIVLKTEHANKSAIVVLKAGEVKVLEPFKIPRQLSQLQLTLEPSDARVFVDDKEVPSALATKPLTLEPDKEHVVRAEKDGFKPARVKVTLEPGQVAQREIKLEPLPRAKVEIKTWPKGAKILLDGKEQGETPKTLELPPGKYRLTLTLHGHHTEAQWLEVKPADVTAKKLLTVHRRLRRDGGVSGAHAGHTPGGHTPGGHTPGGHTPGGHTPHHKKGPPGFLVANTMPWAKVIVDGKDTNRHTPIAPRSKLPLRPGRHKVTFDVKGKRWSFTVTIKSGEITRLIKKLPTE